MTDDQDLTDLGEAEAAVPPPTVSPPTLPPTATEEILTRPPVIEQESGRGRRKHRLYCFHCNRPESHSNPYLGAWFYSYFIGLTFGLLHFIGPFRCQCCGRQRLMFRDWMHPKFHAVVARNRAAAPSRRSR